MTAKTEKSEPDMFHRSKFTDHADEVSIKDKDGNVLTAEMMKRRFEELNKKALDATV